MRKLILLVCILVVSCSTDDDCKYDRAEIEMQYESYFENDNLTDSERQQLIKEYNAKLKESC